MSEEVEQSSVRAYRMRLLNVLIAQDIRVVGDGEGSLQGWGKSEAEAIEDLVSQACEKAVSNALFG